ncbi:MAG TPA: hypothetical protein VFQ61_14070 [Polyangiaceae bacterium]|nr:hypothetical protein [Polyangiaceae bacterium]
MPVALLAGLWGLVAGAALVLGALIGWFVDVPRRVVAAIMAFGSGVLISALSFDLMDEAYTLAGFGPTGIGFVCGIVAYTGANIAVSRRGGKHRKASKGSQASEGEVSGSGLALAIGALLDGIPESMVIGVSLVGGHSVSLVAVIAVFLSNMPEGLSSSVGMKRAGRSAAYVFGVWGSIALISGLAALIGYVVFRNGSPVAVAATSAVAAGAILAMVVDTMVPESFAEEHELTGLVAGLGFLTAFALSRWTR